MKRIFIVALLSLFLIQAQSQNKVLSPTPPMGFMTWNYFGVDFNEDDLKTIADAMVEVGLVDLGYNYIFIDDGWQGGRDNKNNMIPDPKKFPSGIKALADYLHKRGMKLGIYSDAAQLTCAKYTASLGFEEQDAKTFAVWGVDYLKYDYCNAPQDVNTAKKRYKKMADALRNSGREIVFSVCEWGNRKPWEWAESIGGQLWRTTADIRDKWASYAPTNDELHRHGAGIFDILNINANLDEYAKKGAWNDPDMLVVGLYGKKGPSGDLGGTGCTDIEYQTQMSLWCMMSAPLMITCDVRNMNEATKQILMNEDIIAIDKDELGKQAKRVVKNKQWNVFVKELKNGEYAVAVLNVSDKPSKSNFYLSELGLKDKYSAQDVWTKKKYKCFTKVKQNFAPHETKVYRLKKK